MNHRVGSRWLVLKRLRKPDGWWSSQELEECDEQEVDHANGSAGRDV